MKLPSITEEVAKGIASNEKIKDIVVKTLVDKEVLRRANSIVSAIDKIPELDKELNKIKPDISAQYDANGHEINRAAFSKEKIKQVNEIKGRIAKLEKAINKALEGDFSEIFNIKSNG